MPENFNAGGIYSSVNLNMQPFMAGMNQYRSLLGQMDAETSKRMNSMSMVTSAAMLAMGAAMVTTGKKMFDLASAAIEVDNLFKESMGNMTGYAQDFATDMATSLGISETNIKRFVGTFNVMLNSMGMLPGISYQMSTTLTKLAYDMASFYNLDSTEAFAKLRSGISGEIEPLKALGIVIDETTVKNYAYKVGIAALGEELSTSQKVMARYELIMRQTSKAQGDLARTADSPANTIRRMSETMEMAMTNFGRAFMPSAQSGLGMIEPLVQGFKALSDIVMKIPEPIRATVGAGLLATAGFAALVTTINTLTGAYGALTGGVGRNTEAVVANALAHSNLTPFIELEARVASAAKQVEHLKNEYMALAQTKSLIDAQLKAMDNPLGFDVDENSAANRADLQKASAELDRQMNSTKEKWGQATQEWSKAGVEQKRLKEAMKKTVEEVGNFGNGIQNAGAKVGVFTRVMGTVTASLGWISIGIGVVTMLVTAFNYLSTSAERATKKLKEAAEAAKESFSNAHTEYALARDSVAEYNKLLEKGSKTAQDRLRMRDLLITLNEIAGEAVTKDEEGNIVSLNQEEIRKRLLILRQKDIDLSKENYAAQLKALEKERENAEIMRTRGGGLYSEKDFGQAVKDYEKREKLVDELDKKIADLKSKMKYNPDYDKKTIFDNILGDDGGGQSKLQAQLDAIKRFNDQYAQEFANASKKIELRRKADLEDAKKNIYEKAKLREAERQINETYDHQQLMLKKQFNEQMYDEYLQLTKDVLAIEEDRYQKEKQAAIDSGASIEQVEKNHQLRLKQIKEEQDKAEEDRQRRIKEYQNQFLKGKEKERQEIEDWFQEQKKIAEELNQDMAPLYEEYYARLNRLNAGWKEGLLDGLQEIQEEIDDTYGRGKQMAHDIADGFNTMGQVILNNWMGVYKDQQEFGEALADSMKRWGMQIVSDYMNMLMQMLAKWLIMKAMGVFNPTGMAGGPSVGSAGAAAPAPGRASGGPVLAGKTYMVGENGPELFNSPYSGTITPNNQLGQGAMNIKFEVKNATGQDIKVSQEGEPRFEFGQAVLSVVIDGYARDVNGMRTMMKGGLG
jgi:hypothetical protein